MEVQIRTRNTHIQGGKDAWQKQCNVVSHAVWKHRHQFPQHAQYPDLHTHRKAEVRYPPMVKYLG